MLEIVPVAAVEAVALIMGGGEKSENVASDDIDQSKERNTDAVEAGHLRLTQIMIPNHRPLPPPLRTITEIIADILVGRREGTKRRRPKNNPNQSSSDQREGEKEVSTEVQ